ncbi:hypothetical protein I302_104710 [Kwoniella bestiolae CBS 10118]|uniref:Uncharacterized protein n=1 Tax=Kwoniella bestiolae CBS 10118 TaxID=1296100 RepID=A0A1B9FRZ5_9TREE|nr:hypothetical protein I302_09219 [Kwoniella bestiolae CBS 10118]OCF21540.1 hypothetical protein I302_09219 [Kwoniella bestiolae CBS 10118]
MFTRNAISLGIPLNLPSGPRYPSPYQHQQYPLANSESHSQYQQMVPGQYPYTPRQIQQAQSRHDNPRYHPYDRSSKRYNPQKSPLKYPLPPKPSLASSSANLHHLNPKEATPPRRTIPLRIQFRILDHLSSASLLCLKVCCLVSKACYERYSKRMKEVEQQASPQVSV